MSLVLSSQTAANQINKTLWWAISEGDEDQVRTLLDQEGAGLSARTPTKQTALNLAVADGHESIAKLLLEKGASIEAAGHNGEKPLYAAARLGDLRMVTLLLQFKPAIESFNVEKQQSALYISVGNGHEEVAKVLLQHGANVDLRNYGGETALFISAMKGNTKLMALLLQSGASKDIRSQDGKSVFDIAAGDNAMTSLLQTSYVVKGPLMSADRSERERRFTQIPTPPTIENEADEVHASKGFEMTIVDFFLEKHEQRVVNKVSVWDALYGRGPEIIMARGRESVMVDKKRSFRWYHLPSNNMAWVEALVSRLSAEQNSGAAMLTDKFKSNLGLTSSAGQQYQTKTAQSSFMRPMCQFVKSDLETSFGTGARDHVMLFMPYLHYEYFNDYEKMSRIISEVQQGIDLTMSNNKPMWTRMARRYLSIETLNAHGIDHKIDDDPEFILIKRFVPEKEQDSLWAHTRDIRGRRYERTTTVQEVRYEFVKEKAHQNIISKAKNRLKSAARFLRDEPSDSDKEDGSDISISGSDIDVPQNLDESSPPHDEAHDKIKKIRFGSEQLAAAVQDFKERLKVSTGKIEGLKEKGKDVATKEPVHSTKDGTNTEERSLILRRMTDLKETIDSLNQDQKRDKDKIFDVDKPKVSRSIGAESEGKIESAPTHHKSINPTTLDGTPRAQAESVPSSGVPNTTNTKKGDGAPQQINAPPATQRTADFLNENLINGYLLPTDGKSLLRMSPRLQPRRTLDQYFYTHIKSTLSRDSDQVVYRYSQKMGMRPKIFMVDQLWLWILNEDTVISCCPQRWQSWSENEPMDSNPETPPVTLQDDPLNVHQMVLGYLKQPLRGPITSAYDLAGIIADSCASVFDPFRITDEFQFLEFFERSISVVSDAEASCFQEFKESLTRSDPNFTIIRETDLLVEIKDIRDELSILHMVLSHHASTMADLSQICAYAKAGKQTATPEPVDKKTVAPHRVIENHLWRVKRMDQLAEKTYLSLNHLVDLKHKHASILEASSARKQAENTLLQAQNTSRQADYAARQVASTAEQTTASVKQATATAQQGKTILMFTVVTIIFLPLSFMAAFFAIAIDSFPVNENGKLAMSYVLKYMLSVSGAACIPFILVAFQQDRVMRLLTWVREIISDGFPRVMRLRRQRKYSSSLVDDD